jgi:small subunit ribosomal protein S20
LKRIRTSEKSRQRNRVVRGSTRSVVRRARSLVDKHQLGEAEVAVQGAVSALDRAASKGVIHKNNAARRKSRLMRQLNQAKAAAK